MDEFIKEYFEQDNFSTRYPIYFVIRDIDWQACYHFEDADRYVCIYDTEEVSSGKNLEELFEGIRRNAPELEFPDDWTDELGVGESEADDFARKHSEYGCYIFGQKKHYKEKNMFLLKSEAEQHLKINHYHYSSEAHVYCNHAWRAPRQEQFFKGLKK